MEDIKSTLYAVLGKRKLGQPKYTFSQGSKGRQRFLCQVMVDGISYGITLIFFRSFNYFFSRIRKLYLKERCTIKCCQRFWAILSS